MKIQIPDNPKAEVPGTLWGKIPTATPVVMTVISTMLAGLASSEMTRAQYDRSFAAQLQSKAGDQWGYFRAKRQRGAIQRTTLDMIEATSDPQSLRPRRSAGFVRHARTARFGRRPAGVRASAARDRSDRLGELVASDVFAGAVRRDFAAAKLRYSALRYEAEARANQSVASLLELRVRKANLSAARQHARSQHFFYGMRAAQAAVIIATFAIAARQRSLLWALAAAADLAAVFGAAYVYLFVRRGRRATSPQPRRAARRRGPRAPEGIRPRRPSSRRRVREIVWRRSRFRS